MAWKEETDDPYRMHESPPYRIESGEELGGFVRDGHDISAWNVPFSSYRPFFFSLDVDVD